MRRLLYVSLLALFMPIAHGADLSHCDVCRQWNEEQAPFQLFGNSYYVGMHGLSAVLVTSPQGHILIDGDLETSADRIATHVRALGFRVEDIRIILNSHVHFDHAGGIAALQRMSGARVVASPWSAAVLKSGQVAADDPQVGEIAPIPPVPDVESLRDGQVVEIGPLSLTAHFTPGHTPGGTSWSWQSCDADRCLNLVYADSLTAVSNDSYRYAAHPAALAGFAKSVAFFDAVPCDILVSTHPGASRLWQRLAARQAGDAGALIDPTACRAYAAGARRGLAARLAKEDRAGH